MRERIDRVATRIRRDEREAGAREGNGGVPFPAMIRRWRRRWRFWFRQASIRVQAAFGSDLVKIRDVFWLGFEL
ncbi:hypothetical protein Hanom_Chr03g00194571 [Helianthus anomalus]